MINEYTKGLSVQLSPYFTSTEFDCHCTRAGCTSTYIDSDLIAKLNKHRKRWQETVHILSGFRCTDHNREVGGKPGSMHLVGKAADIQVPPLAPNVVADDCEDFNGLGRYKTFTHVDVRGYRARWFG